ncbi:SAM-dependent methyltransferase [Streptomyces sp. MP131-18]|uniref:SAM-dependent methyltransferase n=1 Tax=Streptomyces sp. MP131-18 TaxID=1857892 RepID=UPI0009CBBAD1|nr:SAM-dependent methyltransferase [Streptomyces sp. MP131-18]ONK14864.1 S-adenosyl methyltransferase [Streptomyces sp. MP131-18]
MEWRALQARYNRSVPFPYHLRSPKQIAGYFDNLDLVAPGVVPLTSWRPDTCFPYTHEWDALVADLVGGVGRKP